MRRTFLLRRHNMQIAKPEKNFNEYVNEITERYPSLIELGQRRSAIFDEIFLDLEIIDRKRLNVLEEIISQYENLLVIGAIEIGRHEMARDIKKLLQE